MKRLIPVFILIAAVIAAAVYYRKQEQIKQTPPRNVMLITIDTLRADHVGCYGYPHDTTPNIDSWAEKGAIFTNATSTVPLTLPSHSSIMTGQYPFAHGVRDNGGFYLGDKWKTLAEVLKGAGFNTGGFISAFVLDRRWGIAQGFDEYFDNFELSKYKMLSLDSVQRRGDETLSHALAWLDRNKSSRFFAWIHFYDPHTPYDPPEPFKSEFGREGPYGLYDGEIAFSDNLIGRIHDYLVKNKLLDQTLVVLMSDHGESLGEHEESTHGFFIYDATTHIPLIIWKPGAEPQRIKEQVRSIDIYSTICDAVGVKPGQPGPSTSLMPFVEGRTLPEKLLAYSESYYPKFHYGWSELKALRTPEYKFIDAPERELYRLSQDSRERENIYPTDRKRAAVFEVTLGQLVKAHAEVVGPRAVDSDSLEKLQALGYIGSSVAIPANPNEQPADPKDKIRLYNLIKIAQGLSAEDKDQEAMDKIHQVMVEDPRILEAHLILGNLYTKKKQYDLARESFQNALKLNPDYAGAIFALAKAYEDQEQWDAARAGFERLQKVDPRDPKSYYHLGEISISVKDFPKALSYFEKVIELEPTQGISHNRLGACYLEMKDYDHAEKEFRKALDLNSRMPNAHFNLALIYEARGDLVKATNEYQKELEIYPEAYPAHFNLSRLYHSQGDVPHERAELEQCIQKSPDFGLAYLYLAKSLMDSNEDLMRAKTLSEEGIKRTLEKGQAPFGHYILADIYNRLGKPADAMEQVRQAKSLERQ